MANYPGYGQGMSNGSGIMSVLEPFGDYLNEQIDVQRVDPFLETVSNAAYQEFGIKPQQSGGFFSGGFYKGGGGLPDRDLFGGGSMPHPDEGFDFSNPVPNLPGPIYERPEPNFPEGLFGGLTPTKNVSGLETPDLPQIDQGFFDSPEYAAFNSGPKMGTQDVVFSRYFGRQGSGSISGQQDKAYEDYLRRTGQTDRIITTNPYAPTLGVLPSVGIGNDGNQPVTQPNFMQSALNYFGETYNTFNPDTGMSSTAMTPELMVQQAQGRLAQRDVKPPEVQAYLQNIVETGGNPTMMAPNMMSKLSAQPLMGVLPGGGMVAGQPGPGFGLPSGNGPGGVTLRPGPSSLSGFQGIETVGLGGLQLARTQFG
tara:strand:- start:253 stop:1356 length:1104 start_codon:yes stop_codon:yes gene_type:complete